jgi:translation initiation factor 2 alpha subunit (eIF-2alpha)
MSGGALDYACYKVQNIIDMIPSDTILRSAFKKHLENVAEALHDLEWVLSRDYADGDEIKAIEKVLYRGSVVEKTAIEALELKIKEAQEILSKLVEVRSDKI